MDKGIKWYCLRVVSNKERKIKERLDLEVDRNNWGEIVTQIVVPTEKVYKIRKGKKVIQERTLMPGYIIIQAKASRFNSDIVQTLASMKDVINFLGGKKPEPLRDREVRELLKQVDQSEESGEMLADPFIIGEEIKVIDGHFKDFTGTINEVNEEKKKLIIITKVFGRDTEVELNFMQVEKQS
jgi:transcriptional antiterminator NusG